MSQPPDLLETFRSWGRTGLWGSAFYFCIQPVFPKPRLSSSVLCQTQRPIRQQAEPGFSGLECIIQGPGRPGIHTLSPAPRPARAPAYLLSCHTSGMQHLVSQLHLFPNVLVPTVLVINHMTLNVA